MKAIICKYISATNTRHARIKASDNDGNYVTVPYDSSESRDTAYLKGAMELCHQMEWDGVWLMGWLGNQAVFVHHDSPSFDIRDGKREAVIIKG